VGRIRCTVPVFPLRVVRELEARPERGKRERRWFAPEEAAVAVKSRKLGRIILAFAGVRRRS
jgi:hypothetical protein